MPTWPAHLPGFAHGSLVRQRARNWEEFETDYGPPLRTKRGTASQKAVSAQFVVSNDLADDIDNFYDIDCEEGSVSFDLDGATYMWAEPPVRKDYLTHSEVAVSWLLQPA